MNESRKQQLSKSTCDEDETKAILSSTRSLKLLFFKDIFA